MSEVKVGNTIKVNYTGKFENGEVFDTSLTEGREPLKTVLGQGSLIPGFEQGLLGMTEGENKTIEIVDWGQQIEICDLIINTTSVGLSKDENINLDFSNYDNNKNALFYDLIYNPEETKFLEEAKKRGNKTMNGKMMFLWQAHLAFKLWTGVSPEINDETISLLDQ